MARRSPLAVGAIGLVAGFALSVRFSGFWTRDYIVRKLAAVREAAIENLILCLDAERNCADDELPRGARVFFYRRRVVAEAMQIVVEGIST